MMHIVPLLILILISAVVAIALLVEYLTEDDIAWGWRVLSWGSFTALSAWFVLSYYEPLRIEREFVCGVSSVKNPNGTVTQFIRYDDKLINLNSEMGAMVPEGAKIRVQIPAQGPYLGVYWGMKNENRPSECMKHVYTVVE